MRNSWDRTATASPGARTRRTPNRAPRTALALLLLFTVCSLVELATTPVEAQIFQHFFGGGGAGAGGASRREQEPPPSGDASWFEARVDAATCKAYLCPRTLSCVPSPAHCPCPFKQQTRCPYPDSDPDGSGTGAGATGGFYCVTSPDCSAVEAMRRAATAASAK